MSTTEPAPGAPAGETTQSEDMSTGSDERQITRITITPVQDIAIPEGMVVITRFLGDFLEYVRSREVKQTVYALIGHFSGRQITDEIGYFAELYYVEANGITKATVTIQTDSMSDLTELLITQLDELAEGSGIEFERAGGGVFGGF